MLLNIDLLIIKIIKMNTKKSKPPFVLPLVAKMTVGEIGYISSTDIRIWGSCYYLHKDTCYHKVKIQDFVFLIERIHEDYILIDFTNGNIPFYQSFNEPSEEEYFKFAFDYVPEEYNVNYMNLVYEYNNSIQERDSKKIKQLEDQIISYIHEIVSKETFYEKFEKYQVWWKGNSRIAQPLKKMISESFVEYVEKEDFKFSIDTLNICLDYGWTEWALLYFKHVTAKLDEDIEKLDLDEVKHLIDRLLKTIDVTREIADVLEDIENDPDLLPEEKEQEKGEYVFSRNYHEKLVQHQLYLENLAENTPEKLSSLFTIGELQQKLDEAIATFDYEQAARLRDAINNKQAESKVQ